MEPEPVRQFVSKAARCKARAAFELCGTGQPDIWQRVKIPDVILNCRFACPVRAAGDTAGRATGLTEACHRSSFISCLTARFDLWLIVQEHA